MNEPRSSAHPVSPAAGRASTARILVIGLVAGLALGGVTVALLNPFSGDAPRDEGEFGSGPGSTATVRNAPTPTPPPQREAMGYEEALEPDAPGAETAEAGEPEDRFELVAATLGAWETRLEEGSTRLVNARLGVAMALPGRPKRTKVTNEGWLMHGRILAGFADDPLGSLTVLCGPGKTPFAMHDRFLGVIEEGLKERMGGLEPSKQAWTLPDGDEGTRYMMLGEVFAALRTHEAILAPDGKRYWVTLVALSRSREAAGVACALLPR